jgi:hypothetical protein
MNLDNFIQITQHFHILIGFNKDQFEVNIETIIAHICDMSNVKLRWQWTYILVTSTWTILFRITQLFQILSEFNKGQIKVNIETRLCNLFGWDKKMTFKNTFQRWL